MGYSVMVEFPDVAARDRVLRVLEAHLTPIHDLLGEDVSYVRGPVPDPSYDRNEAADRLIGFDFTTSFPLDSRVAYLLCYWMARRVPGVIVWYDGHDELPVPEACDEHGFESLAALEQRQLERTPPPSPAFAEMLAADIERIETFNERVHAELRRLSGLL